MTTEAPALLHVSLPRQRLRKLAGYLLKLRGRSAQSGGEHFRPSIKRPVKVVCISDTHNLRPALPPGDLLLHAGDLTEWGTFDEIQAQLAWLSSQPHQHKLLIAGNHDLIFDDSFLNERPEHRDPHGRRKGELDFGSVVYLEDESIKLSFAGSERVLNVYGSPWTPRYGSSAFQYPREEDVWRKRVPASTDVLITHGPPARFNDIKPSAGCVHLRQEVARVKPRLMVFGHIHGARGEQLVTFDTAQLLHDDVMDGLRGWEAIPLIALSVLWSRIRRLVSCPVEETLMINAAVVNSIKKDVVLDAFVVNL